MFQLAEADPAHTLGGIKDDIEPEHPSVIGHMVKSLMPGQDLTRVTIPSFFLEPRSLLERMADTQMHPDLLLGVQDEEDPVERMKIVARWFLSGWHYKTVGVKKPYNPIIGETFACYWKHNDGSKTQYFAEQVLHRPPVSAIYFENRKHGIHATSHVWTKSQFSAPQTTKSILEGACLLTLENRDELYYITFPTYYAHNLLMGQLRMEMGDTAHIVCVKTGLRTDIEFQQKPFFGGADKMNSIVGAIRRISGSCAENTVKLHDKSFAVNHKGEEIYTLSGHWDKVLFIASKGGSPAPLLDITKTPVSPKFALPNNIQGPWESRRLWQYATDELKKRPKVEWSNVDREKAQLEEEQRLVPCHLYKEGQDGYEEWPAKAFYKSKIVCPLTGEHKELYIFKDLASSSSGSFLPKNKTEEPNLLDLSRSLPDSRGGLKGIGAKKEFVDAMKSVNLSTKRPESWEKF